MAGRAARAAGASEQLLGGFLGDLAGAAAGSPLATHTLLTYEGFGRTAAESGVPLRAVVDLYLTAGRMAWDGLPAVDEATDVFRLRAVGNDVLAALDDMVAALCQGYQEARRSAVRAEEAMRREFVDDLLVGTSDLAALVERAPSMGLRLEAPHVVLVITGSRRFVDGRVMVRDVEAALLARSGVHPDEPDLLVATKSGQLVCVLPGGKDRGAGPAGAIALIDDRLGQESTLSWRMAVSRSRPGAAGVRLGFEEARATLEIAERLALPAPVVRAEDLLIYQVLGRDREPMRELIRTVLLPLEAARGGAAPLLATLRTYLSTGGVAVHAAQQMHLSVRALTYRLDRIKELTGRDPGDPEDQYVLETALRGALMVGWPHTPL